jgi:hypothetical protein
MTTAISSLFLAIMWGAIYFLDGKPHQLVIACMFVCTTFIILAIDDKK